MRDVFCSKLSEQRRKEIVKLDWHSLRHACSYHFYVTLGQGADAAALQPRHPSKRLVEEIDGNYNASTLNRMTAGALAAARASVAEPAPQVRQEAAS